MSFIIGVCGYHGSGKTTLIEKLVRELTNRGYKVTTIKNIPKDFSIDKNGKDSWRHGVAGSNIVVISSPNETSFIHKRGLLLDEIVEILEHMSNPDVILVEGRKWEKIPKIAVGDIEVDGAIFRYDRENDNFDKILQSIVDSIEKYKGEDHDHTMLC
jgi:molybdopterin-guanine dinucleotide biosynthesis protein MobB